MNPSGYRERATPRGAGLACVWTSALPRSAAGPFVQRVVPDGCVDVYWSERAGRVFVAGPDTGPNPAPMMPGDRFAGVRFRPGMAGRVLGVPPAAVRDARMPLADLWGADAERLEHEAATGAPEQALTSALLARAAAAPPPDPLVPGLIPALARGSVADAADALGFSERQLRRRAVDAFGYGPKTVQRVLRFQRALRLARAGTPFAEVAQAAGYADQTHLAHEVRELGGAPLGAFR
ncbi:helix-turn-helix transcriptional regulator [Actinomadura rayongensis]|uniref:Helix-turn-helix domain-containing protein n=1 Tax=Actinomadura rayongensis TaxID=1429076 RepID=A0A6I4WBJ9_9ACTN|nr:helix-turn-helix transcriptional regulator [Actinomadura rayongensis]MXQ64112.1 helix-turn-helix domain-containing protein [Actinomadura rayongensis]